MFQIVCFLAGIGLVLCSECQTKYGGECHDVADGCPPHLEQVTYNYCGFQSYCCYSNITSGDPDSTPGTSSIHGSCGISTVNDKHRIIGGTEASAGEYPWQVSLMHNDVHLCGGTLIDSQHVLTGAHCFRNDHLPDRWTVGFGTLDRYSMIGSHVRSVTHIQTHAEYNRVSQHNDIAVMTLSSPLDLRGTQVRTACLPKAGESFDGLTCTVTGWGHTVEPGSSVRYLREVDLPIIPNDVCKYYYRDFLPVVHSQICAGLLEGGKDACKGDSGGPLVCQRDGVWTLAGIVSWGRGCAESNRPGVYTRVSEFLDWIHNATHQ